MTEASEGGSKGLFDSLQELASSAVGMVHTRLQLLSLDIEEDRVRMVSIIMALLIALFCLGVGVLLLAILIVVAVGEDYRLEVLGGLVGLFLLASAAAMRYVLHKLKTAPRLFAASLAELAKDRQQLSSRS